MAFKVRLSGFPVVSQPVVNPGDGWFGDGSDGDVVISGGTTTLTRDTFYNNLTVQSTGILNTGHFRIFVKNRLQVDLGGRIIRNGNPASGSTGGAVLATGSISTSAVGAGRNGLSNSPGQAASDSGTLSSWSQVLISGATFGKGGNGLGGGGTLLGGDGGDMQAMVGTAGGFRSVINMTLSMKAQQSGTWVQMCGGTGGGSGGGSLDPSPQPGGGGGGGAGIIVISAKDVVLNGTIEAIGGDAAAGPAVDCGGGGGGMGGLVLLIRRTRTGTGSINVSGGAGGAAGGGAGTAGAAGSPGLLAELST